MCMWAQYPESVEAVMRLCKSAMEHKWLQSWPEWRMEEGAIVFGLRSETIVPNMKTH